MSDDRPWLYVDGPEGVQVLLEALRGAREIGVDTESDSMHSYFEKVCLLQIFAGGRVFLVDSLALSGGLQDLGPVFADPAVRKVFHGADYDVVCLKRSLGLTVRGLFDTMIAAQFLGVARFGLADLVAEHFGEVLEKKHTRTDWARRPLSESELDYAHLDVKRLIQLAAILEQRLVAADILEETEMEFRRLEEREPTEREFDEDGYLRIRGSRDLDDAGLAVLREIYLFRDREARRADRPPFRILVNETMLRIAEARPRTEAALAGVRGVSSFLLKRFGAALLKAVERGAARERPPAPRPRESRRPRMSPRQQRALERLREWRKVEGARRGRLPIVVLPNPALIDVVLAEPRDLAALAAVPGVGEKRARLYGGDMLAILEARG